MKSSHGSVPPEANPVPPHDPDPPSRQPVPFHSQNGADRLEGFVESSVAAATGDAP